MLYFSRWKSALIWLAIIASFIIASPNFFSRETLANLPGILPTKQVALGLDLSGGSRLVLQVQNAASGDLDRTKDIMRQRLEELGYGSPIVEEEGRNRIRVEVPTMRSAENHQLTARLSIPMTIHQSAISSRTSLFLPVKMSPMQKQPLPKTITNQSLR
jgi:preprotein translocase subunit SecD